MNQEEKDAIYNEYKSKLEELDAKKGALEANTKAKYEELKQSFNEKLNEIKKSQEENYEDVKTRIEIGWKAVQDGFSGE